MTNYEWLKRKIEYLKQTPTDECIDWPFSTRGNGYGQVAFPNYGSTTYTHRLAYELYYGHPAHQNVLHRCNNPKCFNPQHLYDGTQFQNAMDRIEAGSNGIKLNNDKIERIVDLLANSDLTMDEIANKFLVSPSLITFINMGKRWGNKTGGKLIRKQSKLGKQYKLNENQVKEIIVLIAKKEHSLTIIAQMSGVCLATVSRIKSGERWKHLPRPW